MKTFAAQILSIVCLVPLVMGAPMRVAQNSGIARRTITPHELKFEPSGFEDARSVRELEDPSARDITVYTKDTTRVHLTPDVDLVVDTINVETFPDDALVVYTPSPGLEPVGGPMMSGPPPMDC